MPAHFVTVEVASIKKRFLPLLMALTLALPLPTLGAETETGFTDVHPGDWFAPYVEVCVNAGLMQGIGDNAFSPQRELTQAELLPVCARLHRLLTQGDPRLEPVPQELLAQAPQVEQLFPGWLLESYCYLTTALWYETPDLSELTTLTEEEFSQFFQLPATRMDLVFFLDQTLEMLTEEELSLESINDIPYLPDTGDHAVLAFCRAGILTGVDREGTFHGESSLTRGELAAVLARILEPRLRISLSLTPKTQWENFSLTPFPLPEGYFPASFSQDIRWGDEFEYFIGTSYLLVFNDYKDSAKLSDRRMGVLNADGSWAIEPEWTSLNYLGPDGFLMARLWGKDHEAAPRFVGVDGRQVPFPEVFRDLSYRHDGYLLFSEWEGQQVVTRVYDLDGRLIVTLPDSVRLTASEGRIPYQDPESGLWGFYDLSGTPVIPALYENVGDFSEGLAAVKQEGKWGFLDREGTMVIPPQFESASSPYYPIACQLQFHEGMAVVPQLQADGSALYGVIDREGTLLLPFLYQELGRISNGMSAYWQEGSTGFVDLSDGHEIPLERNGRTERNTRPFSGGVAPFPLPWSNDDISGYIDKSGQYITPVLFDWAGPIGEDGCGFVSIQGKVYRIHFDL